MTINLVNPGLWGSGDELTFTQANALDANATFALDKRAGETDTLESVVSLTDAGRIIPSTVNGADADTTYDVSLGNQVVRVTGAVTANRIYTLDNTSAVLGDTLEFYCEASFVTFEVTIKDAAAVTLFTLGNIGSSTGPWMKARFNGTDWVLFESGGLAPPRLTVVDYIANGNFVVPATVTTVTIHGMGAGAGGGAGSGGNGCGGGGGGGAKKGVCTLVVTPGATIVVTIGTAGTAGVAGVGAGGDGGAGGDTTFGALATFYGAMGGIGGQVAGTPHQALGGQPTRSAAPAGTRFATASHHLATPGEGGLGINIASVFNAIEMTGGSTSLALGGLGGGIPTQGGCGGGGGASEWIGNVPGVGGTEGVGAGAGTAGTAGTLGAGGGGGASSAGDGTAGGAGGPGALTVIYVL